LTFWAKTNGFAGAANAKVEYSDDTSVDLLFGGADLSPVEEWKPFTVPVDQTKQVKRVEFSVWESDPIYIDDISLSGPFTWVTSLAPVTSTPYTLVTVSPFTPSKTIVSPFTPSKTITATAIISPITRVTYTFPCFDVIINSGFETGDLTGWTPFGPAFDGGVTSEETHSGTYSLQLGAVDFVEQTYSSAISPTSDLTFWAKTEGFAGAANVMVEYSDGTSESLLYGGAALSSEWTQFTVPIDQTKQVSRIEFSAWETAPIYIDDVSLCGQLTAMLVPAKTIYTPIAPKTPFVPVTIIVSMPTFTYQCTNVIVNRGFETGDLTGWTPFGPAFDGGVTSEEVHSGTYSLQLGAVDFVEQTFSKAISPTSNLTFWAKTEGFAGAASAMVEYSDGTSESLLYGGADLSSEWNQFTVPIDQTKQVSRIEFSAWETAPIYIDDISLCGGEKPLIIKGPPPEVEPFVPETGSTPSIAPVIVTSTTSMTFQQKSEEPQIPGFMAIPALLGLIIIALVFRRRRT